MSTDQNINMSVLLIAITNFMGTELYGNPMAPTVASLVMAKRMGRPSIPSNKVTATKATISKTYVQALAFCIVLMVL